MAKSIGIVQPGKLGDIIICLPIAKYYHDLGYKVVWPIFSNFISMLTEVVDYAEFLPVSSNVYTCVGEVTQILESKNVDVVFDIAATFPGSKSTEEYVALGDGLTNLKFDRFKYNKCHVPFSEKWNLFFKRNDEKENLIIKDLVNQENYDIVNVNHSRGKLPVTFESKNQIIEVNEKYNIFHWVKILEKSQCIALVDSAMANLVEQLNLKNKKVLLLKPGHPTPTFKNEWKIKSV